MPAAAAVPLRTAVGSAQKHRDREEDVHGREGDRHHYRPTGDVGGLDRRHEEGERAGALALGDPPRQVKDDDARSATPGAKRST